MKKIFFAFVFLSLVLGGCGDSKKNQDKDESSVIISVERGRIYTGKVPVT